LQTTNPNSIETNDEDYKKLVASMQKRAEMSVKMLRKNKRSRAELPALSMQDALKILAGHQFIVLLAGAFDNIDFSELIAEIEEILKQYPELWAFVDDDVEKLLNVA